MAVCRKLDSFLSFCREPEFQIAFVGTIKTGKSTLINALLEKNRIDEFVGQPVLYHEIPNEDIEKELAIWSSSKRPEHYFVKEIEVGISTLGKVRLQRQQQEQGAHHRHALGCVKRSRCRLTQAEGISDQAVRRTGIL